MKTTDEITLATLDGHITAYQCELWATEARRQRDHEADHFTRIDILEKTLEYLKREREKLQPKKYTLPVPLVVSPCKRIWITFGKDDIKPDNHRGYKIVHLHDFAPFPDEMLAEQGVHEFTLVNHEN